MSRYNLNTKEFDAQQEYDEAVSGETASEDTVDQSDNEQVSNEQTEELILGKFKSVEDLENAYKNLEKKLGENAQNNDRESEDNEDSLEVQEQEDELTDEELEEALQKVNVDNYTQKLAEQGSLDESDYQELENVGITKDMVDFYIDAIKGKAQQRTQSGKELVGGNDEYAAMSNWMVNNLSKEQINEYNQAVSSQSDFVVESAIKAMHSMYKESVGTEPNLMSGNSNTRNSLQPFANLDALSKAQQDPRYATDADYRKEVEQRMSLGFSN